MTNPTLYRIDEIMAIWAKVTAPVLHVEARFRHAQAHRAQADHRGVQERFRAFPISAK
jgi:hypothetical protein